MNTTATHLPSQGVDPEELDRHIAAMYRDVAEGTARALHFPIGREIAGALGYPADLLDRLPAQAVGSFAGVGYHLGLARLMPGERVLDLGSGSGMDVFAAAEAVGPDGSVIGVDITPEQLAKSERLRRHGHVSFRHARIEELPFEDGSFDAVISNGVINLSADKGRVFAEVERVLRPGGRLALADIVTEKQIAATTACQPDLWAACIAGASRRDLYLDAITAAGLDIEVVQDNPDYPFTSDRARRASHKYGAHSLSLLALKPSAPTSASSRITTTTTEEVTEMSAVTDTTRNGVDTEKMFATLDLIKGQPELAKFQFRAANRWIEGAHNRSTIKAFYAAGGEDTTRAREFEIDAGEPAILLGTDTGANPAEYLLHALAACLTTSIVYVAAARKVELWSVESIVTGDMDVRGALGVDPEPRNGFERIGVSFRVTGNATEAKLREIVDRARKRSAVYDMVTNGVPVSMDVSTD